MRKQQVFLKKERRGTGDRAHRVDRVSKGAELVGSDCSEEAVADDGVDDDAQEQDQAVPRLHGYMTCLRNYSLPVCWSAGICFSTDDCAAPNMKGDRSVRS